MVELTEQEREARDLTYTILAHYGYTPDDIAYAEAIHPGTVCGEECHDEDGKSVHPGVYDELGATAALVVEVVAPWHDARVADVEQERDQLKRGGAELGKSLLFWMELARKVTDSDDLIEDDGDGDWGGVAERLAELGARVAAERERADAAEAKVAAVEKLAASAPFSTPVVSVADLRAALGGEATP